MGAKSNEIKERIVSYYKESAWISASGINWHTHPIRLIQAVKSLIGINIEGDNDCLLEWLKIYVKNYRSTKYDKPTIKFHPTEVVSLKQLNQAIYNKNFDEAKSVVQNLTSVSDGRPILEYLLEMSLKQGGLSFLMIKSIMRLNLFMKNSNVQDSLNEFSSKNEMIMALLFQSSRVQISNC